MIIPIFFIWVTNFHCQGTKECDMKSGPHHVKRLFISGQVNSYGGVREKGFRPFLFSFNTSVLHPYGSVSKGRAALFNSPSVDSSRLNPVDKSGSTPTKTNLSDGHLRAAAWSCSKRFCLNENDIDVIFLGYDPVTSLNLQIENILTKAEGRR